MNFLIKKTSLTRKNIILLALAQATGTLLYVLCAAGVLIFVLPATDRFFPEEVPSVDLVLVTGFLMFFITSASVTGTLVFGYPVILVLRQQLKEAILLVTITISIVILFILALAIVLGILSLAIS